MGNVVDGLPDVAEPDSIGPDQLHRLLTSGEEVALLDVREPGVAATEGVLLLAVSQPVGRIETDVDRRIPRRSTSVVVFDGDGGALAERAARRLVELGYTRVSILDGGAAGWAAAGHAVHDAGTQLFGQAFGELVAEAYGTPHLGAEEIQARVDRGEPVVFLDSRPLGEFEAHSLPGAASAPGAELLYRATEAIDSPEALVVVNCAGRTRGILGAQLLIDSGLPNPVVTLDGGTQGWTLAGLPLHHGERREVARPGPAGLAWAEGAAGRMRKRFGVHRLDPAGLDRFRQEAGERSLYLHDVRPPEEYQAGHLPGSCSTPSWELVPWVFRHVATRNARIVLLDGPDLVRASASAAWLVRTGWGEVWVADLADYDELDVGPEPVRVLGVPGDPGPGGTTADLVHPEWLSDHRHEVEVVDLSLSPRYRAGHVPGAWFVLRSRLAEDVGKVPGNSQIVLVSEDGALASVAAGEVAKASGRPVLVLAGGTDGWRDGGLPLEAGVDRMVSEPVDVFRSPWSVEDPDERLEGFRRYLAAELAMVEQLRQDDTAPFRVNR